VLCSDPIRVAILDEVDLVSRGVEQMFSHSTRAFRVNSITSVAPPSEPVDIVLFDGFTSMGDEPIHARELMDIAHARHLVIYSWNVKRVLVEAVLREGASGFLDKRLGLFELTDALEHIHNGQQVVRVCPATVSASTTPLPSLRRPSDLTERETEIISLIAQGLSNAEIAQELFLSVNTIKSYIRMAYRKMSVTTRAKAVLWALDRGLPVEPDWTPDARIASESATGAIGVSTRMPISVPFPREG
jgi:DNA-binding NarL/FixJ family response regulator